MTRPRLKWTLLILAVLIGGGAWTIVSRVAPEDAAPAGLPAAPRTGFAAPDFTAQALDGSRVRLADLRGRPVVINFWATWCPPCKEELPHLQSAAAAYGPQVVFLGVDNAEPADTVGAFVRANGVSYTILTDPSAAIARLYQVNGLPTTFFVDRDGVIRDMMMGPLTPAVLQDKLISIGAARRTGGPGSGE